MVLQSLSFGATRSRICACQQKLIAFDDGEDVRSRSVGCMTDLSHKTQEAKHTGDRGWFAFERVSVGNRGQHECGSQEGAGVLSERDRLSALRNLSICILTCLRASSSRAHHFCMPEALPWTTILKPQGERLALRIERHADLVTRARTPSRPRFAVTVNSDSGSCSASARTCTSRLFGPCATYARHVSAWADVLRVFVIQKQIDLPWPGNAVDPGVITPSDRSSNGGLKDAPEALVRFLFNPRRRHEPGLLEVLSISRRYASATFGQPPLHFAPIDRQDSLGRFLDVHLVQIAVVDDLQNALARWSLRSFLAHSYFCSSKVE